MSYTFRLLTFSPLDKAKPEEISNDSDSDSSNDFKKKVDNNEYLIQMFGINEQGETASIMVTGYTPFFYLKVDSSWSNNDRLEFISTLRNDIGKLIVYLQSCIALDDESKVQDLITLGSSISTDIDTRITALLENKEKIQYPVATTLFFRYLKRIVSHIVNAATALIMPTDQIDYLDE